MAKSTTKKNHATGTEFRAQADAAVETWRGAKQTHDATLARYHEAHKAYQAAHISPALHLAEVEAQIARFEAEDALRTAEASASVALDAAERADGDELAVAADLHGLHEDVSAAVTEIARLEKEVADARIRLHARIDSARKSEDDLRARRHAAALPSPRQIPAWSYDVRTPADYVQVLVARIETMGASSKTNEQRLRQLHNQATDLRAYLERMHREAEERKAREAAWQVAKEAERKADQERQQHAWKEIDEKNAAKMQEERELAEAYRRRAEGVQ